MDELFIAGSMEESQVCTQGWLELMCVHFSVFTCPYPTVQSPVGLVTEQNLSFSRGHMTWWFVANVFSFCLGLIVEISPLFFRPKLSTEKIMHFFFFIKNDFGLIVKDLGSHLGMCILSTLSGAYSQGHFSLFSPTFLFKFYCFSYFTFLIWPFS